MQLLIMVVIAIVCIAVLSGLCAAVGQQAKGVWDDAGDLVHGKKRPPTSFSGDKKTDALDALKQLGLSGSVVEKQVEKAIHLCPDCSLQSIVNLVIQMRNADGGK